jgi:hypothetical protein
MSDSELEWLRVQLIQEQQERAHRATEPARWNAGRLRRHLETMPDETPLLVHVPVEVPGDSTEEWIIPFVITGSSNHSPGAFVLDLERRTHAEGRTIWVSQV